VFVPFAYAEAAANLLTNPALDPVGKIAELKYAAACPAAGCVRRRVDAPQWKGAGPALG
jgi:formate dehydrogenase major subunit